MNSPLPGCRMCFPSGDQPQCRTFETTIGAMRAFGALFDNNRMPMMCQGSDRRYRVCSQTTASMVMPPHRANGRLVTASA